MTVIKATGEGLKRGVHGAILNFSIFSIPGKDFDPSLCSVTVEGPTEPYVRMLRKTTILKCQWIPRTTGAYTITVKYEDTEIRGSPFTCNVEERPRSYGGPMDGSDMQFLFLTRRSL
ncbi:hypothetical protein HDE_13006 [Halotydeus destructor]|nr:hypothetical protein HDE_13006 [Halotydeus destructor]